MQKVLLSSGGMDSYLLAYELRSKDVIHVFVDIGQKYLHKEKASASALAYEVDANFEIVVGPNIAQYEHHTGIIPFRNAQMIMLAALYGQQIYFGVIADEINSDKSPEFCSAMESVLDISHRKQYWTHGKKYQILTPFRHYTKSNLVRRFLANGGDLGKLLTSVSCYDAGDKHCGRCASCFKRWVALVNATNTDNWVNWGFEKHPYSWQTPAVWQERFKTYSEDRSTEILSAFAVALRQM